MNFYFIVAGVAVFALASLFFSTFTFALRDFSKARLADYLERHGKSDALQGIVDHASDLSFITAVCRLLANVLILIFVLRLFHETEWALRYQYLLAVIVTIGITLLVSVAIPQAIAKYAGESLIGFFSAWLGGLRMIFSPVTAVMHATDAMVAKAAGATAATEHQLMSNEIEQEILSVVQEGEKEGVVDEIEREMIESVIQFHNTQAGQIMSARPEIVGLELGATLDQVKALLEESGHSRIPVYEKSLDHIIGILYARDLLKHLGQPSSKFDIRSAMRTPFYIPKTKSLSDLLKDFRLQKVHMAIVLDEYGGTAGLVTIEDLLEELVGEISDEHEPSEPAMLQRINDSTWEADARSYVDELNRVIGLNLPEDDGYDTLGGFVSTTLSRIPAVGEAFENSGAKYTILEAEPQKVNRVRIELIPQPVPEPATTGK